MKQIVFLSLLVGVALAMTPTSQTQHYNLTVYTLPHVYDQIRYDPYLPSVQGSLAYLNDLMHRPFVFAYPTAGRLSATCVPAGLQALSGPKLAQAIQTVLQSQPEEKYMVLAYPWDLPREVVDQISISDIVASTGEGVLKIPNLTHWATVTASQPILVVLSRANKTAIRVEELREIGTVQLTAKGQIRVVKDIVAERLQNLKQGEQRYPPFYNPYGYYFQGYKPDQFAYPYNSFHFGYGYQGYPTQRQQFAFGFPGFNSHQGYYGHYPGYYGGAYPGGFYPGYFGNVFGYNYPSSHYVGNFGVVPGYPSFYFHGQRTPQQDENQEQTTKGHGYPYGSYQPFLFYGQQPHYQFQYQGYPFNFQTYPYPYPGVRAEQYQQYIPYQYQPYAFQQYQPFQYQAYKPLYDQYYPTV